MRRMISRIRQSVHHPKILHWCGPHPAQLYFVGARVVVELGFDVVVVADSLPSVGTTTTDDLVVVFVVVAAVDVVFAALVLVVVDVVADSAVVDVDVQVIITLQ